MTAQKPLRRLAAIVELPSRVRAVKGRFERLGPAAFVAALDVLARDAACGSSVADGDAMLACALWLASGEGRARIDELLASALRGKHHVASAMLDDGSAHKQLSRHGRLPDLGGPNRVQRYGKYWSPPASAFTIHLDEPLALEEREELEERGSWERVPLRPEAIAKQLERLAMRPDPAVLRALLRDRSVRLRDVVTIAARRPTTPAIVEELVAHVGWMARPSVRVAVLENPFTPTRTALLLLPTCRARLRSMAKVDVHPRLRELASLLVA
jgi:hypothetical protein